MNKRQDVENTFQTLQDCQVDVQLNGRINDPATSRKICEYGAKA